MRRGPLLAAAAAAAALALPDLLDLPAVLVRNASPSAPLGLYLRVPGPPRVGDWALVCADSAAARAAAGRGYLPTGVPLLKRVAAGAGDSVCRRGGRVAVNGRVRARALDRDAGGRPLPRWEGCRTLGPGEALLLQEHPRSFDGRYLGPVPLAALEARVVPLRIR